VEVLVIVSEDSSSNNKFNELTHKFLKCSWRPMTSLTPNLQATTQTCFETTGLPDSQVYFSHQHCDRISGYHSRDNMMLQGYQLAVETKFGNVSRVTLSVTFLVSLPSRTRLLTFPTVSFPFFLAYLFTSLLPTTSSLLSARHFTHFLRTFSVSFSHRHRIRWVAFNLL
jgi:hypothetical protein